MKLTFTPSAWEDYLWFQDHDRKLLKRINSLIKDTLRSPFEGIGKPGGADDRRLPASLRTIESRSSCSPASSSSAAG
jgi:Txe/YoeB family toxin of Txe-Axe toxin-antitoxin module